ncbi:unnamed protein product [Cladocopium goreaui]|uniref:Transmembrane protein n=1 Tax=Cladocopium goreaui TaxID=2562237 RepID=A0A9P1GHK7_9DINO|nr:unnamed protein product [Cladocopium goreaui]
MHSVRRQVTFAQQHGLFRAATALTVIYNLLKANCSSKDKVHSTYESLPQVYGVEFFVSHSWSCAPWMKALIISHFLNFDMALTSSFFACLLAVLCLLLRAGSLTGIAEQPLWLLNVSIVAWPLLVFLAVYFLGHLWDSRSFWFDRICVDQQNASLKLQTIQAIPGFVAQSKKMLVLWDDTYFERLWCNYELAIHVKTAASPRATKIVPLWMPFWTLFWICADTLVALLSASEEAGWSLYVFFGFLYAAFCLHKLQGHKRMLDQMSAFDLRNAKCTFEEDRAVIEELVLNLFDEALEPPIRVAFDAPDAEDGTVEEAGEPLISLESLRAIRHVTSYPSPDAIIGQFNDYVRGPLRQNLVAFLGTEDYISPKMCIVATLPIWFQSLMCVLSCDGASCEKSASDGGYASIYQYMITNAVLQLPLLPFGLLIVYPLLLRANQVVAAALRCGVASAYGTWLLVRIVVGTCVSALIIWCNDHLQLALRKMLFFSTTSSMYLAVAAYVFQCFFMCLLFRRKGSS